MYQYVGRLGYYTHYQEPDFSLLQLGVRYYDAEIGRFTQLDPIKDGLNWYVYAANTPLLYTDATGMATKNALDWKKAYNCAIEAFNKCKPDETVECLLKNWAICMGKKEIKENCPAYYCYVFWQILHISKAQGLCGKSYNPCNDWEHHNGGPCLCQDCCDIKYDCCLMMSDWSGPATVRCQKSYETCLCKCQGEPGGS